jgi:xanthine dehydrogenase small subunit
MAAFRFTIVDGRIFEARIAYGGMAATPKRASGAEAALKGALLEDPSTWAPAFDALSNDFTPLTDMRASADYRRETARALLAKALMETDGTAPENLRVLAKREADHDRAA